MKLSVLVPVLAVTVAIAACAPRGPRRGTPPVRPPSTVIAKPGVVLPTPSPSTPISGVPSTDTTVLLPQTAETVSGPAVLSLLKQARSEREAQRPDQAQAALERALRIEPRNAFIWQALASLHVEQQRAELAESTAQKSNSLARGNPYVEWENWRLIAEARKLRGDEAGAEAAQDRADDFRSRLPR